MKCELCKTRTQIPNQTTKNDAFTVPETRSDETYEMCKARTQIPNQTLNK